jgi:gas vesicle protein
MTQKSSFQGPFTVGFIAGLAAGATAVYFFATQKGEQFRAEMGDLWEEAKPELVKKGVIEDSDETLGQAIKSFLVGVFANSAQGAQAKSKKRVRKNNQLFKGV